MRIMGIYAHPADVATEAAGTMAIHADRGDELTAVVLSDGIRMHPHYLTAGEGADRAEPVSHAEYAEFKREEVRRAARIIGIANDRVHGLGRELLRRHRRADRDPRHASSSATGPTSS